MFKKILVPLDSSSMAEAALPLARNLAECFGAEMVVLHVNTPMVMQYYAPEMLTMVAELEQTARIEANTYIHHTAASLMDRGIKASAVMKDDATAANAILDYADHNGVDLIAMSTHGRSGIGRWLLGSVADKVVHGAKMPVLLVRPDESKS
jgi:nucleotide-binding universal stress UspA family protein